MRALHREGEARIGVRAKLAFDLRNMGANFVDVGRTFCLWAAGSRAFVSRRSSHLVSRSTDSSALDHVAFDGTPARGAERELAVFAAKEALVIHGARKYVTCARVPSLGDGHVCASHFATVTLAALGAPAHPAHRHFSVLCAHQQLSAVGAASAAWCAKVSGVANR
jgi:hypothetical protein